MKFQTLNTTNNIKLNISKILNVHHNNTDFELEIGNKLTIASKNLQRI